MKMKKLLMKDPLVSLFKNSLLNLPTPTSISFMWNMGFLLGMCLMLQIVSGITLSMNYIPSTQMGFDSVIHIMRDIDSGWLMRYLHMNGASMFFFLMYMHMGRGIYFNSPSKVPMVWASGVVILLLSMGAAFMGYVLPWGQMSFWGATVITSMISAIPYLGATVTQWLWGNFSVSQPTLNRFFSLHYLLPLVIVVLVLIHLMMLHQTGSSNPTGTNPDYEKMKFFPYFMVKDSVPLMFCCVTMLTIVCLSPNYLGDVENFNKASITSTPPHIQPEWYFLFAYAILRSIPSKLGGVVAMVLSILVFLTLCLKSKKMNKKFSPPMKAVYWVFIMNVLILTWIGANPVEDPFTSIGALTTLSYFTIFTVL
uniref:Cytochrome b n=1 Tax=Histiostomatidae sp. XFX TaxID=2652661 RepID=A0A5J6VF88_9ACAR|nr:cytochrome b [Histiostomatidae sp. XFX]